MTHIGVGLAARGGEVRMTHELATEAALAWSTGTGEGIELVVVLARRGTDTRLVPVAVAATVVTGAGTLSPELAFWHTLAEPPTAAPGGAR